MGSLNWRLDVLLALEMCRLILLSRLSCNFMQEANSNEECIAQLWDCIAFPEVSMDFQSSRDLAVLQVNTSTGTGTNCPSAERLKNIVKRSS